MVYWEGTHKDFHWFEVVSGYQLCLYTLIDDLPDLFLSKYLCISHFDGGEFAPTNKEVEIGWKKEEEIAYSPKLTNDILNGPICDNYDQWYLFENPTEIPSVESYVNYENFSLQEDLEEWSELQKSFWSHIESINPDIFYLRRCKINICI
ncbi:hypothetical protein [Pseudofulvibacter geojedonensis]|uniref:Uncharacterized protein n=1 Tax=Pseudofulvibacter geojedonensis TaxID=1123758 RepID=A0ABW3HYY7_9FLAO